MNTRVLLLTLLVAASGTAAWMLSTTPQKQEQTGPRPLLSDFSPETGQVTSVKIENADGVIFSANQMSGRWLATHFGPDSAFPVNTQAVSALIKALGRASVTETKTSKAEHYARLGVEDIDQAAAQSMQVTLSTGEQQWQIIVGQRSRQQGGTFVRPQGQAESLLVDEKFTLPASDTDWLASAILPFRLDTLEQIEFSQPGKTALLLARKQRNAQQWKIVTDGTGLTPIREDELAHPGVITQVISDMLEFQFLNVSRFNQAVWEERDISGWVVFTLADNSQVMAQVSRSEQDSQFFIWFDTPDSPSWVSEWVFTVSAYQGRGFLTNLADLLAEN